VKQTGYDRCRHNRNQRRWFADASPRRPGSRSTTTCVGIGTNFIEPRTECSDPRVSTRSDRQRHAASGPDSSPRAMMQVDLSGFAARVGGRRGAERRGVPIRAVRGPDNAAARPPLARKRAGAQARGRSRWRPGSVCSADRWTSEAACSPAALSARRAECGIIAPRLMERNIRAEVETRGVAFDRLCIRGRQRKR